jgi:glutathione S-transferase
MAEYTLHCFAQSGNAYKAALMLELAGAHWEPRFVDFFNGATRTPEFRTLNEMGEVPVLVHGRRTLSQSALILDYLARRHGRFRPGSGREREEVLRWLFWDNHKLTSAIATYRFLTNFLPEPQRKPDVIEFFRGRVHAALGTLDRHLSGRDWIVGTAPSTADLSCIGYFFYGDEWGFDAERHRNVAAWRARIAALPGWKHPHDLMPGHPLPAPS